MIVSWTAFKSFVTARNLSVQWVEDGDLYYLIAVDGSLQLQCNLNKNNRNDELADFETNFKSVGNAPIVVRTNVQANPPFGSKTLTIDGVTKKLYARNTGFQQALDQGANTVTYTIMYPWVKLLGAEIVNCEALDTVDFKVYDDANGTYSGVPNKLLNQFGFTVNLPKDYYSRSAPFDADVYGGMVLQLTYTSISEKTIGINLIMNEVKS